MRLCLNIRPKGVERGFRVSVLGVYTLSQASFRPFGPTPARLHGLAALEYLGPVCLHKQI